MHGHTTAKPLVHKFFSDTHTYPSVVFSSCDQDGGCHYSGKNLAKELKSDHVEVAYRSGEGFFKNNFDQPQSYQVVIITGCLITEYLLLAQAQKKYDLASLRNIYFVFAPTYVFSESTYQDFNKILKEMHPGYESKITLLTSGINYQSEHHLGLPNPLPLLSLKEAKTIIPENCYGLMYIRNLIPDPNSTEFLAMKRDFGQETARTVYMQECLKAAKFLNVYFSQIKKIATTKAETSPAVMVIASTEIERKMIGQAVKNNNISIIYVDRLPSEDFIDALQAMSKKQGIIANNGIATIIEAVLLGCHFIYLSNVLNDQLIDHFIERMPPELKPIAEVILGKSFDGSLLNDVIQIEKIHLLIKSLMTENMAEFTRQKQQSLSEESVQLDSKDSVQHKDPVPSQDPLTLTLQPQVKSAEHTENKFFTRTESQYPLTLFNKSTTTTEEKTPAIIKDPSLVKEPSDIMRSHSMRHSFVKASDKKQQNSIPFEINTLLLEQMRLMSYLARFNQSRNPKWHAEILSQLNSINSAVEGLMAYVDGEKTLQNTVDQFSMLAHNKKSTWALDEVQKGLAAAQQLSGEVATTVKGMRPTK